MADPVLCDKIVDILKQEGPMTATTNSGLRDRFGLSDYSSTQFKRALGSLIQQKLVIRSRPQPERHASSPLPTTVRLRGQ